MPKEEGATVEIAYNEALNATRQVATLFKSVARLQEALQTIVDLENTVRQLNDRAQVLKQNNETMESRYHETQEELKQQIETLKINLEEARKAAALEKTRVNKELADFIEQCKKSREQYAEEMEKTKADALAEINKWKDKEQEAHAEYENIVQKIETLKSHITASPV